MNIPALKRYALAGATVLGGAIGLAGEVVLDEATTAPVVLDNLALKTAAAAETLTLPEAWGETNAPTLVIEGVATAVEGTNYVWQTGPLFPQQYAVTLSYGKKEFTALFDVTALASAEWGTLDLDNVMPRVAKDSEDLTLPAAWGETPSELKLVWTDELGEHEKTLDPTAKSYAWGTGPLMPGSYAVKLVSGGKDLTLVEYSVASLGEAFVSEAVTVDNVYDSDPAGEGVRDIASHSDVFKLQWPGADASELTLDGEATGAIPDEEGNWTWDTEGLTRALYTFTNTVNGSNYVARFRVNSDKVAVRFGEATNDVLVASDWFEQNVREISATDSRPAISDALKQPGGNGRALWQSYVLGIGTDEEFSFKSNIRVYGSDPVVKSRYDEEGGTNIYYVAFTTNNIAVWPMVDTSKMPTDTQAAVVYALEAADSLTNAFKTIKTQVNDPVMIERHAVEERTKCQEFFKTRIDAVMPTEKK